MWSPPSPFSGVVAGVSVSVEAVGFFGSSSFCELFFVLFAGLMLLLPLGRSELRVAWACILEMMLRRIRILNLRRSSSGSGHCVLCERSLKWNSS